MTEPQSLEVQAGAVPSIPEESGNLLALIAKAVANPKIEVSKMKELFELHKQILESHRKQAFMQAMARLQAKLPQMNRYGQGQNKNSKYAKLEDIDRVIRPLLAEEGFSFSFDEESYNDKTATFVAIISHKEGHAESKRLTVPIDVASRNREGQAIRPAIQDAGSTVSYARRYLIKMHLNIVETDEDTDGINPEPITQDQANDLRALLNEVRADLPKFLQYMGVESIDRIRKRDYGKAIKSIEDKKRRANLP